MKTRARSTRLTSSDKRVFSGTERRAIHALAASPTSAGLVGQAVWPDRKRPGIANHGGGDYAAQMLLGRLRRRGLVRVLRGAGSSVWELTAAGERAARCCPGCGCATAGAAMWCGECLCEDDSL